jgi:hypothetical protein
MVQSTLTKSEEKVQRNKRDHDAMSLLSDSDDERGDKEDRFEDDDEGSLYAGSTIEDATEEAIFEYADEDDTTAGKKKKPAAKPRKKDQKPLDLNLPPGDSLRRRTRSP